MREINYSEVIVSLIKGNKRTSTQRAETWVIGRDTSPHKINMNKEMLQQIETHVYPKNYKGQRKVVVIKVISTKYLGDSFYYE